MAKISVNVWTSFSQIEKDYVEERINKDGLSYCKLVIREARKQLPGFTKLFGYGKCIGADGKVYVFSGDVTKTFKEEK